MELAQIAKAFVVGVVGIGLVTALFLPGRQTVAGFNAVGKSAQGLLRTSISGK